MHFLNEPPDVKWINGCYNLVFYELYLSEVLISECHTGVLFKLVSPSYLIHRAQDSNHQLKLFFSIYSLSVWIESN